MNDEAFQNLEKLVGKITNKPGVSFCTDGIFCSNAKQENLAATVALRYVARVVCNDLTVEIHFAAPIPHQQISFKTREQALDVFKDISVNLSNSCINN